MAKIKCVSCGSDMDGSDVRYDEQINGYVCLECLANERYINMMYSHSPSREVLEDKRRRQEIKEIGERMIAFSRVQDEVLAAAKWVAMHHAHELPKDISPKAAAWINEHLDKFRRMVARDVTKSNPTYIKRPKALSGGLGEHHFSTRFDQKQLKMGIKVELEHTKDRRIAKMIAMDHLAEIPDYYTRLAKMERRATFRKNPESELDIAIQKMREWAESKAEGNLIADICLGYIKSIPRVIEEGPHMGLTANEALASQLAYAVSNTAGWRGAEARKYKAIIMAWIKKQRQA